MERIATKAAAESLLRELPSVIGAFVLEDVFGHPREVHVLIATGPSPRHFARDIRDLLEERLGVPVDQRVISVAQLARDPAIPGLPSLPTAASPSAASAPAQSPRTGVPAPAAAGPADRHAVGAPAATPAVPAGFTGARPQLAGVAAERREGRLSVDVRLTVGTNSFTGRHTQHDSPQATLRAGARACMDAVNQACAGEGSFTLEDVTVVRAISRDYVLASVQVQAARLGRRQLTLAGAHPLEEGEETAAVLAVLKAVNRVFGRLRVLPPR
jgi:hypothetical protein